MKKKNLITLIVILLIIAFMCFAAFSGQGKTEKGFKGTFYSLVPPVVAIVLALVTKEVYSSLFLGILTGALLYTNFNLIETFPVLFGEMAEEVGDSSNIGIIFFLVILGIIVALINKAGGSAAYGDWASRKIKSKRGALLSTFGLGALIFVDDYFNCLTVGSVMRPVTDKFRISRAKLAYIIDATAAPICIIAPISSWAAAVTSSAEGYDIDGFSMFLRAIPFNFYALMTIAMVILVSVLNIDFASMKKCEEKASASEAKVEENKTSDKEKPAKKGKIYDLIIPVAALIICCIIGMLYTGNIGTKLVDANTGDTVILPAGSVVYNAQDEEITLGSASECTLVKGATFGYAGDGNGNAKTLLIGEGIALTLDGNTVTTAAETEADVKTEAKVYGKGLISAFADCDASVGLVLGSFAALIIIFLLYIPRKVLTFSECMDCIPEGFKAMVPAIVILSFAWTLGGFCRSKLEVGTFVSGLVEGSSFAITILPAIIFLIALAIAFATGTSWGTFAILLPIVLDVYDANSSLLIVAVASVLSGAVCGDHISPISDTTIMSSAGAGCEHIEHVSTQIPYALVAAGASFLGYLVGGLAKNGWIGLIVSFVVLLSALLFIKFFGNKKNIEEK